MHSSVHKSTSHTLQLSYSATVCDDMSIRDSVCSCSVQMQQYRSTSERIKLFSITSTVIHIECNPPLSLHLSFSLIHILQFIRENLFAADSAHPDQVSDPPVEIHTDLSWHPGKPPLQIYNSLDTFDVQTLQTDPHLWDF